MVTCPTRLTRTRHCARQCGRKITRARCISRRTSTVWVSRGYCKRSLVCRVYHVSHVTEIEAATCMLGPCRLLRMFSSRRLGLFDSVPCPDTPSCMRNPCLFSHKQGLTDPTLVRVSTGGTSAAFSIGNASPPTKSILKSNHQLNSHVSVPAKRVLSSSASSLSESPAPRLSVQQASPTSEPPRKIQRLDGYKKAQPIIASSSQPVCLSSLCPPSPLLPLDPLVVTVPARAYLSLIHFLTKRLESRLSALILQQVRSLFPCDRPV